MFLELLEIELEHKRTFRTKYLPISYPINSVRTFGKKTAKEAGLLLTLYVVFDASVL